MTTACWLDTLAVLVKQQVLDDAQRKLLIALNGVQSSQVRPTLSVGRRQAPSGASSRDSIWAAHGSSRCTGTRSHPLVQAARAPWPSPISARALGTYSSAPPPGQQRHVLLMPAAGFMVVCSMLRVSRLPSKRVLCYRDGPVRHLDTKEMRISKASACKAGWKGHICERFNHLRLLRSAWRAEGSQQTGQQQAHPQHPYLCPHHHRWRKQIPMTLSADAEHLPAPMPNPNGNVAFIIIKAPNAQKEAMMKPGKIDMSS